MSSYGAGGGGYLPGMYGQQQLLSNYPMSNYYNSSMGYGGGYYPNTTGYLAQGGYGGMYGSGGYGGGGYGSGGYGGLYGSNGYLPYKQSTLRTIFNRLRHGSSYGHYPYYNQGYQQQMGYDYGRHHHRGNYLDYN